MELLLYDFSSEFRIASPNEVAQSRATMEPVDAHISADASAASHVGSSPTSSDFLFVVLHCDSPALGGARYALSGVDEVEFGRGNERTALHLQTKSIHKLQLTLPGRTISRSHGRLVRNGLSWTFEDNGSRNGSFVNGAPAKTVVLKDGDDVLIGDVLLRFRAGLEAPAELQGDFDSEAAEDSFPGLITLLPLYQMKLAALREKARSQVNVFLQGDSGSGKEFLARGLHAATGRTGPFVVVHCGEMLIESIERDLCGLVKGAIEGANEDEKGFFRCADGGTLFFDEIGDLPEAGQLALLRLLETSMVLAIGAQEAVRVDVRVIVGTQMDIEPLVTNGEFHADLWTRLTEYRHSLAPLVARIEDIGVLIRDMIRFPWGQNKHNLKLAPPAARTMLHHPWPYNIRELSLALDLAAGMANGTLITRSKLPIEY